VRNKLKSSSVNLEGEDPLKDWHKIIESALQAGAILFDGRGHKRFFSNNSINTSTYSKASNLNKHLNPWWNKDCIDAVNKRKQSFKYFIKNPSRESLLEYRKRSQSTRRELNKKKRNSFKNFVNSLDLYRGSLKFWNAIKLFRNSHVFENPSATLANKQDILDKYISRFAPDGMALPLEQCTRGCYPSYFDFKIDLLELREIIDSLKHKSSPSLDLINNTILKLIPDAGLKGLSEIFERILKGRIYPESWKKFIVILLQKPTKEDFRSISLASYLLKVLERLVKRRLERFIELDYLIPDSQWGFRKGRSCEKCLAILNLDIYNSSIKGELLGAIFLDIKSAYDNVSPTILFKMINSLKIPWGYKRFLRELLGDRSIEIYESGIFQGTRNIYRGLPQGSVLSPLLFNLYVKDILLKVPHNCKVIQFADDIVIYCQSRSSDTIFASLAGAFNNINSWLLSLNLELSVPKTQFIVFNRLRKRTLPDRLISKITLLVDLIRLSICIEY